MITCLSARLGSPSWIFGLRSARQGLGNPRSIARARSSLTSSGIAGPAHRLRPQLRRGASNRPRHWCSPPHQIGQVAPTRAASPQPHAGDRVQKQLLSRRNRPDFVIPDRRRAGHIDAVGPQVPDLPGDVSMPSATSCRCGGVPPPSARTQGSWPARWRNRTTPARVSAVSASITTALPDCSLSNAAALMKPRRPRIPRHAREPVD
jgi:hypothetical protein